jgi:hypothetical protein
MAESRNLVPKIGLAVVAAFFLYGWAVVGPGATGSPVAVLGVPGTVLLYAAIFATLATIFIAARRAHRAGSWAWFVAVIFVWPLSYLYALAVNRRG